MSFHMLCCLSISWSHQGTAMDFHKKILEIIFVCLLCWKIGCSMEIICTGVLQVEPGTVFHMGSELTVLCRSYSEHCGRNFFIYLNSQLQGPLEVINCSTVRLQLKNIAPNDRLTCTVSQDRGKQTVCGADLQPGFPPEKPTELRCFAQMDSEHISCTWNKGRETHLSTKYIATFKFKNWTESFHLQSDNESSVSIPWSLFDVDVEFRVKAWNDLGEVVSVIPLSVRDVVIPNTPKIIAVEFGNSSRMATLHWNISDSSGRWRARIRIRDNRGHREFWGTELGQGVLLLEGLWPRTWYEFQIQACSTGEKCSHWSQPVQCSSPGATLTKILDVWRILRGIHENGARGVTVLWKPLRPEDYRDVMVGHKLVYWERGQRQVVTCGANVTEKTLHLAPAVTRIFIYAVTSTEESPPATLHISQSDGLTVPWLRDVAPVDRRSILLTWDKYLHENQPALGYVVQWQSQSQEIQWKRLTADCSSTQIEGLDPGVRFNISLYAVMSIGMSNPAFHQAYSREEKPLVGPKVTLLKIETTRILIRWEELNLEQQRGFLTNYTVYMRKRNTGQQLTLKGLLSRQMWLNHLDTPFDLHISASNSAGEGPLGEGVFCQLQASPKDWSNIGLGLAVAVPLVILVKLMCWNCAQRRITRTFTTVGFRWLFENFPKVENSTATKLLQEKGRSDSQSSWRSMYDDPLITPVEIIPAERTDRQPSSMVESADVMCKEETPGEPQETGLPLEEEHAYKPQITSTDQEEFPEEEDNPWVTSLHSGVTFIPGEEERMYSPHVSGLLTDWLCVITQDRSGTSLNATGGIHLKGTPPLILTAGSWLEEGLPGLGDCPENIDLEQTVLPDQLISCLRSPAIELSPTSFLRELPCMSHNSPTNGCV
ncbi:hypothetical protein GJAV_G00081790 [Gymnothorax javanicus]|nr:hypothetical protein GJAV_G00081790 [Gymnothorax javanicus]